jgi:hypothetical protein
MHHLHHFCLGYRSSIPEKRYLDEYVMVLLGCLSESGIDLEEFASSKLEAHCQNVE